MLSSWHSTIQENCKYTSLAKKEKAHQNGKEIYLDIDKTDMLKLALALAHEADDKKIWDKNIGNIIYGY